MTWHVQTSWIEDEDFGKPVPFNRKEEHGRIPAQAVALGFESPALPDTDPLIRFRLYDDDGELYYEGELHDDDECDNQLAALTWGEPYAGCTIIKVLRDGEWKQEIA